MEVQLQFDRMPSPIGDLLLVADEASLVWLEFGDLEARLRPLLKRRYGDYVLSDASNPLGIADRLNAYFAGEFAALDTIPVDTGGTPFQRTVWHALRRIPAGSVASYGQLAATLGRPTACRAVGHANGANPVPLVLPCHRVIGGDGSLTGYGGGLDRKRWLLAHERGVAQ